MIPELFYFDELADPAQAAELPELASSASTEICWQPQEIARLRGQTSDKSGGKMPHEKTKL